MGLDVNHLVFRYLTSEHKRAFRLDQALVKRWASDLRRMTKIYRDIPADQSDPSFGRLFEETRELFRRFRQNWHDLVFEKILSDRKAKTWWEDDLRKKAWDAYMAIEPYQLGLDRRGPTRDFAKRDTNVRRYQRAFGDALKALTAFIENSKDVVRYDDEKFSLSGIQVVIKAKGRTQEYEKNIRSFLSSIDRQIKRIRQAGFGKAVDGMTLVISLFPDDFQQAGQYIPAKDELFVGLMGMSPTDKTFIHEVGHRYYFKIMPSNARKHWEEMINKRMVTITSAHVREFANFYPKMTDREVRGRIDREINDPMKREVFKHLLEHRPGYTSDPREIEDHMSDQVGTRANLEFITEYGSTDAWEAFAEAWQLYIIHGPRRLGSWTRWFFETVAAGGRMRQADLMPPLGWPGGRCHVVERIEKEVRNPKLQDNLQEKVERGKELSNPEASRVYDVEVERGPWKFTRLVLTVHAQYRMDLRGVTVPELRLALNNYFRKYNNLKSKQDPMAKKMEMAMMRKEKVEYTDPKTGMTIVFTADISRGQIDVVTVWWQGFPDPSPVSQCVLRT